MNAATKLTMAATVVASEHQISCAVADEVVLLSIRTGEYHSLNPVAAYIWGLIQRPCSLVDVRTQLLSEFVDVTAEQCEREVLELMTELLGLGLVEVC